MKYRQNRGKALPTGFLRHKELSGKSSIATQETVKEFVERYNQQWLVEKNEFLSPR